MYSKFSIVLDGAESSRQLGIKFSIVHDGEESNLPCSWQVGARNLTLFCIGGHIYEVREQNIRGKSNLKTPAAVGERFHYKIDNATCYTVCTVCLAQVFQYSVQCLQMSHKIFFAKLSL